MQLGRLGVWDGMDGMSAAAAAAFAERVEDRGYGALWIPEGRGRNALVLSSWLLSQTKRLIVATGIANIYARDAMAMASGQCALAEQSGGRFLLGVGVSHRPTVEGLRGHAYGKSVATMRAYLQAMREAPLWSAATRRQAADGRRGARAEDDGALGRARRWCASLQHDTGTHRARARDSWPRQASMPGGLGIARERQGEGAQCRTPGALSLSAARKLRQRLASPGL